MRNFVLSLIILTALPLAAQRHKLIVNAETPEGALLQMIGQEAEGAPRRTAMMESFMEKHGKHESAPWVLQQMQATYLKASEFDKALGAGEKLLSIDPMDVETSQGNLKAAEWKKDPILVLKWAGNTSAVARKIVASPKPKNEDEVEEWERLVNYSKQVDVYTEYSLYATGLQSTDAKIRLQLFRALETQNPQSQYMKETQPLLFMALQQSGDNAAALSLAEKLLATDPTNDDMLLFAASQYFGGMKDKAKVVQYAQKLVEVLPTKVKPNGVADADWQKNISVKTGIGYWMMGMVGAADSKWPDVDKHLRLALPNVQTNNDMKAETLFYLGLANFKMGEPKADKVKIADAYKFSQQSAAMPGKYQGPASSNVKVMKLKYKLP